MKTKDYQEASEKLNNFSHIVFLLLLKPLTLRFKEKRLKLLKEIVNHSITDDIPGIYFKND